MRFKLFVFGVLMLCAYIGVPAQTGKKASPPVAVDQSSKATAAYAEIALRRADVEAELESLLVEYTDEFPKVRELKYSLTRVDAEVARLAAIKSAERDRATSALGKLMVRKVEAELELWKLSQDYADNHPEVRRAKKKVEIYERAIKEILG